MATPVLNNGIFLGERSVYLDTRYIDAFHVSKWMGESKPTDIDPVSIWARAKFVQAPLYNLALVNKKNTITVTDPTGRYSWKLPIAYELPQIVEDIEPTNTQKGLYEATFKLKFNRGDFGPSAIITPDQFNGPEVYIVDGPTETSNGYVYTCKLTSNMNSFAYLDNLYIQPGMVWFIKSIAYNEWSTKFQGENYTGGFREYYNYAPTQQVDREFHITEGALNAIKKMENGNTLLDSVLIYKINRKEWLDMGIASFDGLMKELKILKELKKAIARGDVGLMIIHKKEAEALDSFLLDIENKLMWGQEGRLVNENQGTIVKTPGLWRQMDFGYKTVYNYHTFSLDIINEVIYNFFAGKADFKGNEPDREVIIDTGMGGMDLVNRAIAKKTITSGFQIKAAGANSVGAITGNRMNLEFGLRYSGYYIPYFAKVTFRYNPALDHVNADEVVNPRINGQFRLSSYSFLIFDIGESLGDSITFLKHKDAQCPQWVYKYGSCDEKLSKSIVSLGDFSGYKLNITQYIPGIHVKNPTRVAKIVMRNPNTGDTI